MIKNSAKKGKNRKGQTGGSMVTDMKSFFVTESGKKLASYYELYITIYVTLCLYTLYFPQTGKNRKSPTCPWIVHPFIYGWNYYRSIEIFSGIVESEEESNTQSHKKKDPIKTTSPARRPSFSPSLLETLKKENKIECRSATQTVSDPEKRLLGVIDTVRMKPESKEGNVENTDNIFSIFDPKFWHKLLMDDFSHFSKV